MHVTNQASRVSTKNRLGASLRQILSSWQLYVMALPTAALLFMFSYMPMFGTLLAFKRFRTKDGILGSPWMNPLFRNFEILFRSNSAAVSDEVVQLYVRDVQSSIVTPLKLLRGFERITLAPDEEKTVTFTLGFDDFKLLNKKLQWVVEPGDFIIMAGASSEDIRLSQTITL